jgi:arabinose-5-phosphate isomerase
MDDGCQSNLACASMEFFAVLEQERDALVACFQGLRSQTAQIETVCGLLAAVSGDVSRAFVSGIGKAGLIARKVAATLSSTGTPAAFIHPVEGLHGDIGSVRPNDVVVLFSYSGETSEVIRFANQLRDIGCDLIAITRSRATTLGSAVNVCIETGDVEEACYLGLAPTSSTTVMLAIGDALALAAARQNGFEEHDFARNHPAGSLGLKFRSVRSVMRSGERFVCVPPTLAVREVVERVTKAKTGAAIVATSDGRLSGIFTDGDLRRSLLKGNSALESPVSNFATSPCRSISADGTLAEAMNLFKQVRIEDLPVIELDGKVVGLLCLKDVSVF